MNLISHPLFFFPGRYFVWSIDKHPQSNSICLTLFLIVLKLFCNTHRVCGFHSFIIVPWDYSAGWENEGHISMFQQCSLSYWVVLMVPYHAYLIPFPSGLEHCINPPEPRWPDATEHRINHRLHCIFIIDWNVSLSIYDLEKFHKDKLPLRFTMHLG